jgi:asparagine synthase (glutamine-hydrolysing)
MIGAIVHRGPNGRGMLVDAPVGLAHARLSIVDLAGGAQPMTDEAGWCWRATGSASVRSAT